MLNAAIGPLGQLDRGDERASRAVTLVTSAVKFETSAAVCEQGTCEQATQDDPSIQVQNSKARTRIHTLEGNEAMESLGRAECLRRARVGRETLTALEERLSNSDGALQLTASEQQWLLFGAAAVAMATSPYLTSREAAAYLRMTESGLRSLVHREQVFPYRLRGRNLYTREILDAYVRGERPADAGDVATAQGCARLAQRADDLRTPRARGVKRTMRDLVGQGEPAKRIVHARREDPTELRSDSERDVRDAGRKSCAQRA